MQVETDLLWGPCALCSLHAEKKHLNVCAFAEEGFGSIASHAGQSVSRWTIGGHGGLVGFASMHDWRIPRVTSIRCKL